MKKYRIYILIAALIAAAVLGTLLVQANDKSDTGSNDITLNILETAGVPDITSLSFSVEVKNVSDNADVKVEFSDELDELDKRDEVLGNIIRESTYKDKKLNIYIAGTQELFQNGTDLDIGTIVVDGDKDGAKKIKLELIDDSVRFINKFDQDILFQEEKVELLGDLVNESEEPADVNKKELNDLINEYSKLVKSEYTQESWIELEKVLEAAKQMQADTEAAQQDVDAMVQSLKKAFGALVRISSDLENAKGSLENKLTELNKLLSSEFTDESWNALYSLMQQAQLMLDNGATKEEIEDILTKLNKAQSELVKEEVSKPENTNPAKPDKGPASDTGDESNVMLWVILAGIALVGVIAALFLTKKKDK